MKHFAILAAALLLAFVAGCTSNDKDQAGPELIVKPAPTTVASGPAGATPISWPADPAANGGSTLRAVAPYSETGKAPAPQNVNPGPFLTASRNNVAGGNKAAAGDSLTSRADGTMSGPRDLPAATTGW